MGVRNSDWSSSNWDSNFGKFGCIISLKNWYGHSVHVKKKTVQSCKDEFTSEIFY